MLAQVRYTRRNLLSTRAVRLLNLSMLCQSIIRETCGDMTSEDEGQHYLRSLADAVQLLCLNQAQTILISGTSAPGRLRLSYMTYYAVLVALDHKLELSDI